MCEFCLKHGEGKKWYLRAANYSREMMEELKVKERALHFTRNFNEKIDRGLKLLGIISKMPNIIKNTVLDIQFQLLSYRYINLRNTVAVVLPPAAELDA